MTPIPATPSLVSPAIAFWLIVLGALISGAAKYFPKFAPWYNAQPKPKKQLFMGIAMLVLAAAVIFDVSTRNRGHEL